MEEEKTFVHHQSVIEWLGLCLKEGAHCPDWLDNPMIRNYYSNFSWYHGKIVSHTKKQWPFMESSRVIEAINNKQDGDADIEYKPEWFPFCNISASYLDYEEKVFTKQIAFGDDENFATHLNCSMFTKKLMVILGIQPTDDRHFILSVPMDVNRRIEEAMQKKPFSDAPLFKARKAGEPIIKKGVDNTRKSVILRIGNRQEVVSRLVKFKSDRARIPLQSEKDLSSITLFYERKTPLSTTEKPKKVKLPKMPKLPVPEPKQKREKKEKKAKHVTGGAPVIEMPQKKKKMRLSDTQEDDDDDVEEEDNSLFGTDEVKEKTKKRKSDTETDAKPLKKRKKD